MDYHAMTMAELKVAKKELEAEKKPKAPLMHKKRLRAVEAWIMRRSKR